MHQYLSPERSDIGVFTLAANASRISDACDMCQTAECAMYDRTGPSYYILVVDTTTGAIERCHHSKEVAGRFGYFSRTTG
jgi:hypothetical protein